MAMIRSRPRFAAYDIGGPQLECTLPLAVSWSSCGCFTTILRSAATSSRQMASITRQASTSRGQLATV